MKFDIDKFRVLRADDNLWQADLYAILAHYQTTYFADVKPIVAVEFVPSIGGSGSLAAVFPNEVRIEVDERMRYLPKWCCFLVLHELVNNKLFKRYGEVKSDTSPEFQVVAKSLFKRGAYFGLL